MKTNTILSGVVLAFLCNASSSIAAPIAIIDSGTDLRHPELFSKQWVNPKDPEDAVDNDNNGYIDDTHGWNFANNNNKLFEKKLLGTFPEEIKYFFDVQLRMFKGAVTEQDREWLKEKRKDAKFVEKLGVFGNFVHGTHVAAIAARDASHAEIMPLKILPTKAAAVAEKLLEKSAVSSGSLSALGVRKKLVSLLLEYLAQAQGKNLEPVTLYLRQMKPRVANCSFGTSTAQLKPILGPLIGQLLGHPLTEAEWNDYAKIFMKHALEGMMPLVNRNKATFFVFAAGNDGTNNDELPASPANIKKDNSISVAATMGTGALASFSNFGEQMVDVAAPGVGIRSAIPGGEYLILSGTSQAAPYVSNLAGRIWDLNPNLSMRDMKSILMLTVDRKDFLMAKVKSGGIVNPERALLAAQMALKQPLDAAIEMANQSVRDMPEDKNALEAKDAFVTPMMSLIQ